MALGEALAFGDCGSPSAGPAPSPSVATVATPNVRCVGLLASSAAPAALPPEGDPGRGLTFSRLFCPVAVPTVALVVERSGPFGDPGRALADDGGAGLPAIDPIVGRGAGPPLASSEDPNSKFPMLTFCEGSSVALLLLPPPPPPPLTTPPLVFDDFGLDGGEAGRPACCSVRGFFATVLPILLSPVSCRSNSTSPLLVFCLPKATPMLVFLANLPVWIRDICSANFSRSGPSDLFFRGTPLSWAPNAM